MNPTSIINVVAPGTTNLKGETAYGASIRQLLDGARSKWARLNHIDIYGSGKGVVQLTLWGDSWHIVNTVKEEMCAYLVEHGQEIVAQLPRERILRPAPLTEAPPLPAAPAIAAQEAESAVRPVATISSVALLPAPPVVPATPPPEPDPVLDSPCDMLAITEDILYVLAQRQRPRRPRELAARLECPEDVVDVALGQLSKAGLVTFTVESVFSITEAGAQKAAQTTHRGGRKAIMEELLAAPNYQLTTYDLAKRLGCSVTVPKDSIRRLIEEGLVEPAGKEPRRAGKTGRARTRFCLTAEGIKVGHDYVPPTGPAGWGKPGRTRLAVAAVLLKTDGEVFRASDIADRTRMPIRSISATLNDGHTAGYLTKEVLVEAPLTHGYRLTAMGRAASIAYLEKHRLPPLAGELLHAPAGTPSVYKVTINGSPAEVAALISSLEELGCNIEAWPD